MLNPNDVQSFMEQRGIQGEILRLEDPTPTVELAARAVETTVDQIVKSILFLVEPAAVRPSRAPSHPARPASFGPKSGLCRRRRGEGAAAGAAHDIQEAAQAQVMKLTSPPE